MCPDGHDCMTAWICISFHLCAFLRRQNFCEFIYHPYVFDANKTLQRFNLMSYVGVVSSRSPKTRAAAMVPSTMCSRALLVRNRFGPGHGADYFVFEGTISQVPIWSWRQLRPGATAIRAGRGWRWEVSRHERGVRFKLKPVWNLFHQAERV